MTTTTTAMTTRELTDRLRRHYLKPGPMPGGIFIEECGRNGDGNRSRVDALYVGFTSTSGRLLVGHEVKVSRADWRRELDKVGKADVWHDDCHQWWIVAPSTDIVPPDELPDGWGLLVVDPRTKTRLKTVVKAKTRDVVPSWATVRSIMARLDTLQAQRLHAERADRDRVISEEVQKQVTERQRATLSYGDQRGLDRMRRFEKALGVDLGEFDSTAFGDRLPQLRPESAAAAVRMILAGQRVAPPAYTADQLHAAADKVTELQGAVDEFNAAIGTQAEVS